MKKLVLSSFLIASFLSLEAQKIKYKDLFPVLNAKNWTQGGPQLLQYLSDPKNADEANPNLQLGLMMEDKFLKLDVTEDTVALFSAADSAVFFFEKAKGLITEKELKKNDEYYQSFFRRDLRTGEFGIKMSDVHLDIEKKIEVIEKRSQNTRDLFRSVVLLERSNRAVEEKYKQLGSNYGSYNELLLGADEAAMTTLLEIRDESGEVKKKANEVASQAKTLNASKFSGDVVVKDIESFETDGMGVADINDGVIEIWNYEDWAFDVNSEINGSVALFKSMITQYSGTIRGKKEEVKRGVDVEVDTLSQELVDHFDKYDPNSVIKSLLLTEASEVRIMKMTDLSINEALQDSSRVGEQLDIFSAALEEAEEMSSTVQSIIPEDLTAAKKTYGDYINSFFQKHGTAGNYVSEMKTWSNRQKSWLKTSVDFWTEKNRWGIVTVEGEPEKRVALFVQDAPESEFFTLGVPVLSNDEVLTYGVNISAKKGFIYSFDQGRDNRWNLEFDLPGEGSFKYVSDTIPAAAGSMGLYLMNPTAQENNMTVVSFNVSGAINWTTLVTVPKKPVDFKFDDITQELTILLYPEEELPLANDELGYLVIDRTGSVR